eukprot:CAMPEP_0202963530 /NCGR_PEP_ID=MMETSP1396-20130829/7533_1 /ASSEMBLY_ACC=CAM_ASM_000872 /TAXON_ID= /ORGANISM="Pseudokeronopsis sp., Strain Brazil" /LENGTH=113 /DNA_ID=CAMNT_0049684827 /DNA_START=843 /DNA_END=1186 /DNA_ORIENTATION=-
MTYPKSLSLNLTITKERKDNLDEGRVLVDCEDKRGLLGGGRKHGFRAGDKHQEARSDLTFKCEEEKDILELFVTTRGNEICMSTLGGIKFANLTEKSASSFQFKENLEEQYFP